MGQLIGIHKAQVKMEAIFLNKGIPVAIIGFLLGRALILSQLSPFALPFFAAVFLVRRDHAALALYRFTDRRFNHSLLL